MPQDSIDKTTLQEKIREALIHHPLAAYQLGQLSFPIPIEEHYFPDTNTPNWKVWRQEGWTEELTQAVIEVEAKLQARYRLEQQPPGGSTFI